MLFKTYEKISVGIKETKNWRRLKNNSIGKLKYAEIKHKYVVS